MALEISTRYLMPEVSARPAPRMPVASLRRWGYLQRSGCSVMIGTGLQPVTSLIRHCSCQRLAAPAAHGVSRN